MRRYDFERVQELAAHELKNNFKDAAVRTARGWHGRVHIKIVSPDFNGLTEAARQNTVWEVLKHGLGPDAAGISLVLPYGTDEDDNDVILA